MADKKKQIRIIMKTYMAYEEFALNEFFEQYDGVLDLKVIDGENCIKRVLTCGQDDKDLLASVEKIIMLLDINFTTNI